MKIKLKYYLVFLFFATSLFISLRCEFAKTHQVVCTSGQISNFFIRNDGQVWRYVLNKNDLNVINQKIYPKGLQFTEPDLDLEKLKPTISLRLLLSDGRTLNYYFDNELECYHTQIGVTAGLNDYRSSPNQLEELRLLMIQILKRHPDEYKNLHN